MNRKTIVCFIGFFIIGYNVPRTGDVATKAERVFSAKIEFIRENRAEATQNQQ